LPRSWASATCSAIFGAAGFGWYIGALAKAENWNAVFFIAGLAMALYATGWLFFDATRPVLRESPSPSGRGPG